MEKKKYTAPVTEVHNIELSHMIAATQPRILNVTTNSESDLLSRENDWDWDWDDED